MHCDTAPAHPPGCHSEPRLACTPAAAPQRTAPPPARPQVTGEAVGDVGSRSALAVFNDYDSAADLLTARNHRVTLTNTAVNAQWAPPAPNDTALLVSAAAARGVAPDAREPARTARPCRCGGTQPLALPRAGHAAGPCAVHVCPHCPCSTPPALRPRPLALPCLAQVMGRAGQPTFAVQDHPNSPTGSALSVIGNAVQSSSLTVFGDQFSKTGAALVVRRAAGCSPTLVEALGLWAGLAPRPQAAQRPGRHHRAPPALGVPRLTHARLLAPRVPSRLGPSHAVAQAVGTPSLSPLAAVVDVPGRDATVPLEVLSDNTVASGEPAAGRARGWSNGRAPVWRCVAVLGCWGWKARAGARAGVLPCRERSSSTRQGSPCRQRLHRNRRPGLQARSAWMAQRTPQLSGARH